MNYLDSASALSDAFVKASEEFHVTLARLDTLRADPKTTSEQWATACAEMRRAQSAYLAVESTVW